MLGKPASRIIIVCDEKTQEYANYLRQLISVNDDIEEKIVGTADGSAEAAVWLEKEYLANSATISSNEHILFIGKNITSKRETASMIVRFDKYGMKFGWLGKRAMMQVDDALLDETKYCKFIEFCSTYEQKFEKLAYKESKKSTMTDKAGIDVPSDAEDEEVKTKKPLINRLNNGLFIGPAGAKVAANAMAQIAVAGAIWAGPVGAAVGAAVGAGAIGVYKGITAISARKKIKDQQYRALTVILYMDGLKKFLEG